MCSTQAIPTNPLGALVKLIQNTTGLDGNQAKTVVYYATATYGLPKLQRFPILTIQGPYGTGKTTLLEVLRQVVSGPVWLDGKVSKAVLRDSFRENSTILVDEGDSIREQWLVNRYARQSAYIQVNREAEVGWTKESLNVFGATVLHRRTPLKDAAILSRSITITTRFRQGVTPFREEDLVPFAKKLVAVAGGVQWVKVGSQGERIADTWEPLLLVAKHMGDTEWSEYAKVQMDKARADMRTGQGQEPTEAVFEALLSIALTDSTMRLEEAGSEPRVLLGDVSKCLQEEGHTLSSWQIGQILRGLDFQTKTAGGKQYVYIGGAAKLREVGQQLGIEDEWVNQGHEPP